MAKWTEANRKNMGQIKGCKSMSNKKLLSALGESQPVEKLDNTKMRKDQRRFQWVKR